MTSDRPVRRASTLRYLPSVDGLRAVAVGAVFLFHAGVTSGGFIGVDVFFVISGFLITALAVGEVEAHGQLGLGSFWARRARRLLPAMLVLVAAVVVYSVIEGGAALNRVGRDAASTIFYVANWAQIGEGRDYFATYDAPPLLEHAWSLAVEEQFYIVWPLVIAVVALGLRGRTHHVRTAVGAVALAVAAGSVAITMILRSDPAVSLSRLYYGTDTRAVALAVGAVAGTMINDRRFAGLGRRNRLRDVMGLVGAVALIWLAVSIDGSERWLYGPGFLLIALLSLVVLYAAMGVGPMQSALSVPTIVLVGTLSYGIYLWHWPVIVVFDSDRTGLDGIALGALWVIVTGGLAAASWYLIERRAPLPTRQIPVRALGYAVVAVLLAGVAVTVSNRSIVAEQQADYAIPPPLQIDGAPEATVGATIAAPEEPGPEETGPEEIGPERRVAPTDRPLRLLVVGDSVAESLGASNDSGEYEIAGAGPVTVMNVGGIACPVIQEGRWWLLDGSSLPENPVCSGRDRYDRVVDEFEPDVVLSLFGWPGGGGQELDDGTIVQPCEAGFDELWLRDYREMVERLEQSATVVISTVAPPAIPVADQGPDPRCFNELIRQIDAPRFDYQGWLCPDYDCAGSASLRSDGVHFRNSGPLQRDVMDAIVAQVLTAAGY